MPNQEVIMDIPDLSEVMEEGIVYIKKSGQQFYEIIQLFLELVFRKWKEEIEVTVRPYVAS